MEENFSESQIVSLPPITVAGVTNLVLPGCICSHSTSLHYWNGVCIDMDVFSPVFESLIVHYLSSVRMLHCASAGPAEEQFRIRTYTRYVDEALDRCVRYANDGHAAVQHCSTFL